MYRITIYDPDGKEVKWALSEENLTHEDEKKVMEVLPNGYFMDVCRVVDDPLSDTMNFRDEAEYAI